MYFKLTLRNRKNGQIFMFDLILSFIVLVLSFSLIFNYYMNVDLSDDVYQVNKKILDSFTNTKINSLNNKEIRDMFVSGKIKNIENTVAQQVAEFYYNRDFSDSQNLTKIFVESYLDNQMNFNLSLINETGGVFELFSIIYVTNARNYDDGVIVSSRERVILGFNNSEIYGPYTFKTTIWK